MRIFKNKRLNSMGFGHIELAIAAVVVIGIAAVGVKELKSSHAASYNWTNIGLINGALWNHAYKIAGCQTNSESALGKIYKVHILYSKPSTYVTQQYFAVVYRPPNPNRVSNPIGNSWIDNTFAEETVTASANLHDYLYVGIIDKAGTAYFNNNVKPQYLTNCY
jgi:hypothetical protein